MFYNKNKWESIAVFLIPPETALWLLDLSGKSLQNMKHWLYSVPHLLCVLDFLFSLYTFTLSFAFSPLHYSPLYSPVSYDPPPLSSLSILARYLPSVHGLIHPPVHQLCWTRLIEAFAQRVFNFLLLSCSIPLFAFYTSLQYKPSIYLNITSSISHLHSFFAALVGPFPQSIFIVVCVCMSMCLSNLCTVK